MNNKKIESNYTSVPYAERALPHSIWKSIVKKMDKSKNYYGFIGDNKIVIENGDKRFAFDTILNKLEISQIKA